MTHTQNTQSKVQHTPGPWHTNGGNIYAQRNPGGIRTSICEVFRDAGYDACRANAHLIAAAPELLRACELMLPYFEGSRGATEENVQWVLGVIDKAIGDARRAENSRLLNSAIQKARGQ